MLLVALRERTISKAICLEHVAGRIDFRNAARKKEKIFGKIFYKKCYTFEKILHIKYESEKRPPVKVNLRRPVYNISSAFLPCRARIDIGSTYAWRDAHMAVDWLERR